MSATYTGNREIFEEKFTFFVPFFELNSQISEKTYKGVNGLFNQYTLRQKQFDEIFVERVDPEYDPLNPNQNAFKDAELLNLQFINETKFATRYPYKFVKRIELIIDTVSIQTYNNFEATRSVEGYQQLTSMLPIQIIINNKEVDFTSDDNIQEFTFDEYGQWQPTGETISTNDLTPPERYKGNLYIQSYNKVFELSSVPQRIDVSLNINNNLFTQYRKTQEYRLNPIELSGEPLTIQKAWFYNSFINTFRIDGRIIQYIDYQTPDTSGLIRPSRMVEDDPMTRIINIMKKLLPEEKVDERDLLENLEPEEIEDIKAQIENKEVQAQFSKEEYINEVSKKLNS